MTKSLAYTIGIIITGSIVAYTLYRSFHFDNIFQIFVYIPVGIAFSICIWKSYTVEKRLYNKTKPLRSFYSTFTGLFFMSLIFGILAFYLLKINSQSFIKAENHGVYADFKTDGSYIIKSGSWATKTHFYGYYRIKDSVIILDKDYLDNVVCYDKFLIRKDALILLSNRGEKISDFDITYFRK